MDVKRMYCMIEKLAECAEKQFICSGCKYIPDAF